MRKSVVRHLNHKGKGHIAVIVGGDSSEREISISSGEGVINALLNRNYQITWIDLGYDIAMVIDSIKPDLVFNCLHGLYGEDGCLPGLLNMMKIPYTDSGVTASAIAIDKNLSKQIFLYNEIPCARSIVVRKAENYIDDPLSRPYIIKPLTQGSSIGVELVLENDNFAFSDYKFEYGDTVLVEEYIKGQELQVAILDGKALEILEVQVLKNRFYDYESKYSDGFTKHIIPVELPKDIREQALKLSEKAYKILGCRGLCRAEMIYSKSNNSLYFLEINTHPGFTALSICPEIAQYCGISFEDLVESIIKSAQYD